MDLQLMLDKYLQDNKDRLAKVTLKNRELRLRKAIKSIELAVEEPSSFFELVKDDYKAYTLKTLMLEISNWYKWAVREGYRSENLWSKEVAKRAQYFKNSYQPKEIGLTYDEMVSRINKIPDNKIKEAARELLGSGLRAQEIRAINAGQTTGKGGKVRKFYGDQRKFEGVSIHQIRRALKKVDLTPHDLRKMFATRLARSGKFDDVTLCKIMGWSSFNTARSYLQPDVDSEIKSKLEELF